MKKLTKTNFKSFIRKNADSLKIMVNGSFDGMSDMVEDTGENQFRNVVKTEKHNDYNYGISGLWLVGQSRDYFSHYEDENHVGIAYSNCVGHGVVAITK